VSRGSVSLHITAVDEPGETAEAFFQRVSAVWYYIILCETY
jgi:hypothetical protein